MFNTEIKYCWGLLGPNEASLSLAVTPLSTPTLSNQMSMRASSYPFCSPLVHGVLYTLRSVG